MCEVQEETGIKVTDATIKPFFLIRHYTKNYHQTGKNRENAIYYYIIKNDTEFNKDKITLTDREKEGNFEIKTIKLDNIEKLLIDSINDNLVNEVIVEEMLEVIKEYNKITKRTKPIFIY